MVVLVGMHRLLYSELVVVVLIEVRRWWALVACCGGAGGRASPVIVRVLVMMGTRCRLWVVGTCGLLLWCWWVYVTHYCSSNGDGRRWVSDTRGLRDEFCARPGTALSATHRASTLSLSMTESGGSANGGTTGPKELR